MGIDKCVKRGKKLLKIGVEGFEKRVLKGLSETLQNYRPFVLMEFSPTTRYRFITKNEKIEELAIEKIEGLLCPHSLHCKGNDNRTT